MKVNQREYDWVQAQFLIGTILEDRITELNYSDKTELKNNYGAGNRPISRSVGKYEASGDITLYMSAVEELQLAAPGGDLAQIPAFPIIVTMAIEAGQTPVTHKLYACQFTGNQRKMSMSGEGMTVQLELVIGEIDWKA